jgi:hypothetical protein
VRVMAVVWDPATMRFPAYERIPPSVKDDFSSPSLAASI